MENSFLQFSVFDFYQVKPGLTKRVLLGGMEYCLNSLLLLTYSISVLFR